jgi:hypothetical protein
MKYMVAELMRKAESVWCENSMICIKLADKMEIRFSVEANK